MGSYVRFEHYLTTRGRNMARVLAAFTGFWPTVRGGVGPSQLGRAFSLLPRVSVLPGPYGAHCEPEDRSKRNAARQRGASGLSMHPGNKDLSVWQLLQR